MSTVQPDTASAFGQLQAAYPGASVNDMLAVLLDYLQIHAMFPEISLERYLVRVGGADAAPDVSELLKTHCPARGKNKFTPEDKLAFLAGFVDIDKILRQEGLEPETLVSFVEREAPLFLAAKVAPPNAAPAAFVPATPSVATAAVAALVPETPPADPPTADATLWIGKADYLRAKEYLGAKGPVGAVNIGDTLVDFTYDVEEQGAVVHVLVSNGEHRPFVDPYIRNAQGEIIAECLPRLDEILGLYEFTLPGNVLWRLLVRTRGVG